MLDYKKTIFFFLIVFVIVVGAILLFINDFKSEATTDNSVEQKISLEENPTTGFTWHYIIEDPSIVEVVSDSYQENPGGEKIVGAGGIHTFYLKGLKEGTTTIKFDHYRSWEGIEKSIDSKIFSVTVSPELEITEITELE